MASAFRLNNRHTRMIFKAGGGGGGAGVEVLWVGNKWGGTEEVMGQYEESRRSEKHIF